MGYALILLIATNWGNTIALPSGFLIELMQFYKTIIKVGRFLKNLSI